MTDINFSAAIGAATPADAADGPLWSFNGVKLLAGPGGSVILHKLRGDRRIMVQPDVAEAGGGVDVDGVAGDGALFALAAHSDGGKGQGE